MSEEPPSFAGGASGRRACGALTATVPRQASLQSTDQTRPNLREQPPAKAWSGGESYSRQDAHFGRGTPLPPKPRRRAKLRDRRRLLRRNSRASRLAKAHIAGRAASIASASQHSASAAPPEAACSESLELERRGPEMEASRSSSHEAIFVGWGESAGKLHGERPRDTLPGKCLRRLVKEHFAARAGSKAPASQHTDSEGPPEAACGESLELERRGPEMEAPRSSSHEAIFARWEESAGEAPRREAPRQSCRRMSPPPCEAHLAARADSKAPTSQHSDSTEPPEAACIESLELWRCGAEWRR